MDEMSIHKHISRQFNEELEDIRNRLLAMGGLVEQQIADALAALVENDVELAEKVITSDYKINAMEVAIDEECTRVIARRQPAASDLRLVMAVVKSITDLERIGDEAEKIGHMAIGLAREGARKQYFEIQHMGQVVKEMVTGSLDALARMDCEAALRVAREDVKVNHDYQGIVRQMMTFMMEDPRTIGQCLNVIWAARALERIGDHARNICEYVIYLVQGKDVRHTSLEHMEQEVLSHKH